MERLSHKSFKHRTNISCYIGEDDFFLGEISIGLIFRKPTLYSGDHTPISNRSAIKLLNKISGKFGVKVKDIAIVTEVHKIDDITFSIPYRCRIITNLKAERRNKLRVLLSE